jgi:riboflavin kinase/FMN adenylyltransferase
VYLVKCSIAGRETFGMMNIGTNPTVGGENQSIEIHFFDFEGNLYGTEIAVSILNRLRDEQKFESLEALTAQLHKDKNTCLSYLQSL